MKRFIATLALAFLVSGQTFSPPVDVDYTITNPGAWMSGNIDCTPVPTPDGCVIYPFDGHSIVNAQGTWGFNTSTNAFENYMYQVTFNGVPTYTLGKSGGVDGGGWGTKVVVAQSGKIFINDFMSAWSYLDGTLWSAVPGTATSGTNGYHYAPTRVALGADPAWITTTSGAASQTIGFIAPTSDTYAASSLAITAKSLPTNGTVTLAGGAAVASSQTLSIAELTGLKFQPTSTTFKQPTQSSFTYQVMDATKSGQIGAANFTVLGTGLWADPSGVAVANPGTLEAPPTVLQPSTTSDLVGIRLSNTAGEAAGYYTHGQIFHMGTVQTGDTLCAKPSGGSCTIYVQKDVKNTWPDGSVKHAILSWLVPSFSASPGYTQVVFAKCGVGTGNASCPSTPTAAANATTLQSSGYNPSVSLTYSLNGSGTEVAGCNAILAAAIGSSTVSQWLSGPVVNEFDVVGSFDGGNISIECQMRVYSDGTRSTDYIGDNTWHFTSGTFSNPPQVNYTVSASDGWTNSGNSISHKQWSLWRHKFSDGGIIVPNLQIDVPYWIASGAFQFYDTGYGITTAGIGIYNGGSSAGNDVPMTTGSVTTNMGGVGDRADIGPLTNWSGQWLLSQHSTAFEHMMTNATAGASAPWNFTDTATGSSPDSVTYPSLSPPCCGGSAPWSVETAHQPDLNYMPYIVTGRRWHYKLLMNQANWSILNTPGYGGSDSLDPYGYKNVGFLGSYTNTIPSFPPNNFSQIRAAGWNLREVAEAAFVVADTDPLKSSILEQLANGLKGLVQTYVVDNTNGLLKNVEGALSILTGTTPGTHIQWNDAFVATSATLAAKMAISSSGYARELLEYMLKFDAGAYVNGMNGYLGLNGPYYKINSDSDPSFNGTNMQAWHTHNQTWYDLYHNNISCNSGNGANSGCPSPGPWSDGYAGLNGGATILIGHCDNVQGGFGISSKAALAGEATVTKNPKAIQAWAYLESQLWRCMPIITGGNTLANTTNGYPVYTNFDIVPNLNGDLITHNQYQFDFSGGTVNMTATGTTNSLVAAIGNSATTLTGKNVPGKLDIITVSSIPSPTVPSPTGAQADVTDSGSAHGAVSISAGTADSEQIGSCAPTTFNDNTGNDYIVVGGNCYPGALGNLAPAHVYFGAGTAGHDSVDGFRAGTDRLHIGSNRNGSGLTSAAAIVAAATVDAKGNTVLHFGNADITVVGIATPSSITASITVF